MKPLDLNRLNTIEHTIISSEEALKDITPINWSNNLNNYKYKWKYEDHERPQTCCYDCRMKYGEFPDMVVPDDVWEKISPTYWQGAGLLCPTCMANRLEYIGEWYENGFFLLKHKDPWPNAEKS